MPAATVITSQMLTLAGVPAAWSVVLLGLTKAAAADIGLDILDLRVLVRGTDAAGMTTYTLDGQAVTSSMLEVAKLRALFASWKNDGRGPQSVGICLG